MPAQAIRLTAVAWAELLRDARDALPDEAVGLLGGTPDGGVCLALPLPNVGGPRSFLADPHAQFQAERELKARRLTLLAVYHSHPGGTASLSKTDLLFARLRPTVVQVVVALDAGGLPTGVRAYACAGEPTEVQVRIASLT